MRYLILSLLAVLLFSCNDSTPSKAEIQQRLKERDFTVFKELPSCSCNDLEEIDGSFYQGDSLYTGNCYLNYPNLDAKYEIRQLYKGEFYGNRILLSPKGDTLSQNEYKHGDMLRQDVGSKEVCECSALETIERADGSVIANYYDTPFTGTCQRFFPAPNDDKVYLEVTYKNGVIHGNTKVYDKNGKVILKEHYVNGEKQ